MADSARTRRIALSLALIVLVALLVFAVARTLPRSFLNASATATARPTAQTVVQISFSDALLLLLPDPTAPVYPGQTLTVKWQVQSDANQPILAPALTGAVALLGPFTSEDAAHKLAYSISTGSAGEVPTSLPLALEGPSLTFEGGTTAPQVSTVTMPNTFAPGYYVLDAFTNGTVGIPSADEILLVDARPA